jgi:hypothetical protein
MGKNDLLVTFACFDLLPSWLASLQAFALVANSKLGLQHISIKNFVLKSILYGRNQRLLLFPSHKHKKFERKKQKDSDNISVKCKYYN